MIALLIASMLSGCTPDPTTRVTGTIFEGRRDSDPPLGGADVVIVDSDGAELGAAIASADGSFDVQVPSGTNVFVEVRADGWQPGVFSGVVGLEEELAVDVRLYPYDPADIDELNTAFADCPGAGSPGGIVVGEIRLDGIVNEDTGEQIIVTTGSATVNGLEESFDGCYFDHEGLAFDPTAEVTGLAGFFVVFGVPPGRYDLDVEYEYVSDAFVQQFYPLWIPEEGAVSPWFPANVPFVY